MACTGCVVEPRDSGVLPSRDSVQTAHAFAALTPRHKVGMAQMILLAGVLAILVALVAPRPDIVIASPSFSTSACDATTMTQVVTASFLLVNRGNADGTVDVRLSVDDTVITEAPYSVLAQGTTPGTIVATLHDCAVHAYALGYVYDVKGG